MEQEFVSLMTGQRTGESGSRSSVTVREEEEEDRKVKVS